VERWAAARPPAAGERVGEELLAATHETEVKGSLFTSLPLPMRGL
jgi:hypothetical protein